MPGERVVGGLMGSALSTGLVWRSEGEMYDTLAPGCSGLRLSWCCQALEVCRLMEETVRQVPRDRSSAPDIKAFGDRWLASKYRFSQASRKASGPLPGDTRQCWTAEPEPQLEDSCLDDLLIHFFLSGPLFCSV